jgi:hypothetical protein
VRPVKRRIPLTRGDCVGGERPCPHETCRHHIPPVPGDVLRRRAACVLDLADLAELYPGLRYGDLQQSDIAWHLGISRETAGKDERGALTKLAAILEDESS